MAIERTDTLGDALPREIKRCQELVEAYRSLGPAGAFGAAMIQGKIADGIRALAEADPAAMVRACAALRECE